MYQILNSVWPTFPIGSRLQILRKMFFVSSWIALVNCCLLPDSLCGDSDREKAGDHRWDGQRAEIRRREETSRARILLDGLGCRKHVSQKRTMLLERNKGIIFLAETFIYQTTGFPQTTQGFLPIKHKISANNT